MPTLRLLLCLIALPAVACSQSDKEDRLEKWEKEIAAIEKRHAGEKHDKGGVVFIGSSTIRLWDTKRFFPEWKPVNSGFGGSEIRDATLFADRILLNHEPTTIVFYGANNDLHNGRTPDQVEADLNGFVAKVREKLPETRIYVISTMPSLARWAEFDQQTEANKRIRKVCESDKRMTFVDVVDGLLSDGKPIPEMYVKDGLHLTDKGYGVLADRLKKAMAK